MYPTHQTCLLCSSRDLIELPKFSNDYLTKCRKCSFVFCKRIPTDQELLAVYAKYPRNHTISPITIKRYHELLDIFESYRKTNKMLDIGCGDGYFLREAKSRGWQVYGTEYTDNAFEIGKQKGIIMHQGVLDPGNYHPNEFDIITSFEVIEHINNPQPEIQNIKKILRPGGVFYVTTPNFNSVSRFLAKKAWNIICYPEHLSYYTAVSMNRFFKNEGFKKIKVETTGISLNRLKVSYDIKSSPATSQNKAITDEEIRQKTETNFLFKTIKKSINFFLNLFKIGDSLKAFYQKK